MTSCGLKPTSQTSYATYLVELDATPNQLRGRLSGKWRSALHKAEQLLDQRELRTDWTGTPDRIRDLLRWNRQDQLDKGYRGAHPNLLKRLLMDYANAQALLLGVAYHKEAPCSAIAVLCHGRGATYQLAWNSKVARQSGANNLLLWQAMLALQQRDASCLDLGGFNDEAPGLQRFKAGLGGRELRLAGMFA
jgi:lipid II:glycine glycyltransferase (peptidoglycan interpeptide bridge formation enzyme)